MSMLQSLPPMLEVKNMEATISFYEQKLSFQCVGKQDSQWARLEKDKSWKFKNLIGLC